MSVACLRSAVLLPEFLWTRALSGGFEVERLADAMAAEAKATAKAAAKPKAKGKAQAGSVCIFDAWSGCHFGVMKSSSFWLRYRRPLQWTFQCSRVDSEAVSEQVAVVANHVLSQVKPNVNHG